MNFDAELGHLAAMDTALTTLTAGVHALDCGPTAIAALITPSTATAEARLASTERLMAWLDIHDEDPEARSVIEPRTNNLRSHFRHTGRQRTGTSLRRRSFQRRLAPLRTTCRLH